MKACKRCKQVKALDGFYKHPEMADEHLNYCKECLCKAARLRRLIDPAVRENDNWRSQMPARKEHLKKVAERWNQKRPDGYKAHNAVSNALRDGKITKQPCFICASTAYLHAHHKDYSDPLKVVWLCARCHSRFHLLLQQDLPIPPPASNEEF